MREARRSEELLFAVQISSYFQAKCRRQAPLRFEEWTCIQSWRGQGLDVASVLKGIDLAVSTNAGRLVSLVQCMDAVREVSKMPS
jgi:hypothetical protein